MINWKVQAQSVDACVCFHTEMSEDSDFNGNIISGTGNKASVPVQTGSLPSHPIVVHILVAFQVKRKPVEDVSLSVGVLVTLVHCLLHIIVLIIDKNTDWYRAICNI